MLDLNCKIRAWNILDFNSAEFIQVRIQYRHHGRVLGNARRTVFLLEYCSKLSEMQSLGFCIWSPPRSYHVLQVLCTELHMCFGECGSYLQSGILLLSSLPVPFIYAFINFTFHRTAVSVFHGLFLAVLCISPANRASVFWDLWIF